MCFSLISMFMFGNTVCFVICLLFIYQIELSVRTVWASICYVHWSIGIGLPISKIHLQGLYIFNLPPKKPYRCYTWLGNFRVHTDFEKNSEYAILVGSILFSLGIFFHSQPCVIYSDSNKLCHNLHGEQQLILLSLTVAWPDTYVMPQSTQPPS